MPLLAAPDGRRPGASASGDASAADRAASEARFFDGVVGRQGDFDPFTERGWRTLAGCFERLVAPRRPLELLDVGCGTGRSLAVYVAHVGRYVGVDVSRVALCTAASRLPQHLWLRADALRLPLGDGQFDVTCFSSVLHHIANRRGALAEARRVVRPGGAVFAFDPNLLHPAMALFRWPHSPLYVAEGVSPNESPLLPSTLRDDFAAAGLVDVVQRCQSDIPFRHVTPRLLRMGLAVFNLADRLWEISGLGRWFGSFVVTAGRRPG